MMDIHFVFDRYRRVPACSRRTPIVQSINYNAALGLDLEAVVTRKSSDSNTGDKLSHLTTTRTYDYNWFLVGLIKVHTVDRYTAY
jgi:hypothetical protein